MAEAIKGLKKMERTLERLARQGAPKVARAGMSAMATPLKKSLRAQVNGATMPARIKKAARPTINSKVKKQRGGNYGLRVGFGDAVGKTGKAKAAKATARAGGNRPGVGISATNVHWIVYGTGEQSQLAGIGKSKATGKAREKKSGASTGSTRPYLAGLLPVAIISGMPGAVGKAAAKMKLVLQKEARKRR